MSSASCVWKGPSTLPSVELGGLGWSIASTRRDRPRISERRMNSYGTVSHSAKGTGLWNYLHAAHHYLSGLPVPRNSALPSIHSYLIWFLVQSHADV
jgi:hypothetical protein